MQRNMIPYPRPGRTPVAYNAVSSGGVGTAAKTLVGDAMRYVATVTDATAAGGSVGAIVFGEYTRITVNEGERYSLLVKDLFINARPATGLMRVIMHWCDTNGTAFASSFGDNLLTAGYYDSQRVTDIAPPGAKYAYFSISWQPNSADAAVSGTLDFQFDKTMIEPLGTVKSRSPIAIENLITMPTAKYDVARESHVADGYADGTGWIEHIGGVASGYTPRWAIINNTTWSPYGRARFHRSRSGNSIIPGTIYKGFVGSYILPRGQAGYTAYPGEPLTFTIDVNVTEAGSVGDPGCWLEIVWFFYDGDPAHSTTVLHDNSDHLLTPGAVALGPRTLSMTKYAPTDFVAVPGLGMRQANIAQLVVANATSLSARTIGFWADKAMLTRTDRQIPYFDGDSLPGEYLRPSWTGIPGQSSSLSVGPQIKTSTAYFDGDDADAQWDGPKNNAMSSKKLSDAFRTRVLTGNGKQAAAVHNSFRPV